MPLNTPSQRNRSIDALRAIAALLIVLHHSYIPHFGMSFYDAFLNFFHDYGRLGVDLFFILSGFCIHWGNSKPGKEFDPKNYLLRRWWRIYPPYFFALGLAVILNIFTNLCKWRTGGAVTLGNFGLSQVLSHVFLVHNLFSATLPTISGPFWTIAVEAQFYLMYLFARPFFFSPKGWFFTFFLALLLHLGGLHLISLGYAFQPWHPLQYWIEWVLGAYVAYCLRKRHHLTQYWSLWLILCVACWTASGYLSAHGLNTSLDYSQYLSVLGFVFLTLLFFHWERVWSFPGLKWIPFLGSFSYSIYLIHFLIIDRIRVFIIPVLAPGLYRVFVSLLAMFFALVVSYVFFLFFEKPYMEKSASWKSWDRID